MLAEASTPMMPALAEDSTASITGGGLSMRSLGADQFVALGAQLLCHLVEGLAEVAARSPSDRWTGTWTCRSPVETILAALISRRIGATSQLAKFSPIRTEAIRIGQRDHRKHQRERHLNPEPAGFQLGIFGDARLGSV